MDCLAHAERGGFGVISVVVYGRNDSHGYNLHKRAALSLNCIAELLAHNDDEILFVDYNTPDDFPTFPEAIQDTLTARTRGMLRILRVRPKHHQRFKDKTHLVALEPVARNVAIQRSNPANRWILSTNTDMIFVPRRGESLSDIAAPLADGYYHLPRFEVPESLWESLNRMDPRDCMAQINHWGRRFHLNEVVRSPDPTVKYDGPGDFQLILRSDLFKIGGFHEEMLLGWHVDWNIALRLHLLHGGIGDLVEQLSGYHCDHTRQVTPAHRANGAENDIARFIYATTSPLLPAQAETWGLSDEPIEELRTGVTSTSFVRAVSVGIEQGLPEPAGITFAYDRINYETPHALPFVLDVFSSYPSETVLGWFGTRRDLLSAFAASWRTSGFEQPILVADGASWLAPDLPECCVWATEQEIGLHADLLLYDWGLPIAGDADEESEPAANQFVSRSFNRMLEVERSRLSQPGTMPRRFIGVNAVFNRYENLFCNHIGAARAPIATRIRQGYLIRESGRQQSPEEDQVRRDLEQEQSLRRVAECAAKAANLEAKELRSDITALRNSTSWRLTEPVRTAVDLLRRMRRF